MKSIKASAPFLVLALAILAAYGGSIANGFVWDDLFFLQDIQRTTSVGEALHFAFKPLLVSDSYVRPLPLLTFYFDYFLFGSHPAGWHAVTLFLHFLNSSLVLLIARSAALETERSQRGSTLFGSGAALVFALHPALTEDVLWISSRFDLLATLFMLLGIHVSTLIAGEWKRAVAVASCFFLAALCKESTVVFPAIIGIFMLLRASREQVGIGLVVRVWFTAANIKMFALMVLAGLGYLVIRHYSLTSYPGSGVPEGPRMFFWMEVVIRSSTALTGYIQLTLVPFIGNALHHPFTFSSNALLQGHAPEVAFAVLVLALVVTLVIRRQAIGWVIITWLVAYAPVLQLLPILIGDSILQQRFMYLPTALLAGFLAFGLRHIRVNTGLAKGALSALVVVLLLCTVSIRSVVPMWSNNLVLWTWARTVTPGSAHILSNLVYAYLVRNMHEPIDAIAEELFTVGARTDPMVPAYVGMSHFARENHEAAVFFLEMANSSLTPRETKHQVSGIRSMTALSYAMVGEPQKARQWIRSSLQADPTNFHALGVLMAMCEGHDLDTSRFHPADVRDAMSLAQVTRERLEKRPSSGMGAQGNLCPSTYIEGAHPIPAHATQ